MAADRLHTFPQKPRVFILSDISNEPDDAESLCRYLLYANQFETEGLVACTSTWMKNTVCPQDMEKIIDAYAGAVGNLNKHVHPDWPYPTAGHLRGLIKKGAEVGVISDQADQSAYRFVDLRNVSSWTGYPTVRWRSAAI